MPAPTNGSASGGGCPDVQAALDVHNAARAKTGAAPLAWSSSIASMAQAYASKCVFQHSGVAGYGVVCLGAGSSGGSGSTRQHAPPAVPKGFAPRSLLVPTPPHPQENLSMGTSTCAAGVQLFVDEGDSRRETARGGSLNHYTHAACCLLPPPAVR